MYHKILIRTLNPGWQIENLYIEKIQLLNKTLKTTKQVLNCSNKTIIIDIYLFWC